MLAAFLCLCFTLYLLFGTLNNMKAKSKAEKLKQEDEGIPDISAWSILEQGLLSISFNWNKPVYEASFDMRKKHGPVHMIRLGKKIPIRDDAWINNTNDLELAKKVMTTPSVWPDRLPSTHYLFKASFGKPLGLLFGTGDHYKRPHRLLIRLLHKFEFFKPSRMESLVLFEAQEVEAAFEEMIQRSGDGRSVVFCPHTAFERNTLNIILQVVMSHRFLRGDVVAEKIIKLFNKSNREFRAPVTILETFPWLQHIPWLTFLGSLYDCSHYLYDVLQKIVDEKRRELREFPSEPKDLVDGFILEIDKLQGTDEYVTDQTLLVILRDMIFAGVDTVNSTLEHSILHLSLNPEIQQRVQGEIDQVVGPTGIPQYADKARMPYTQAVLLEVLRIGSAVPATMRTSADDTILKGTKLKKGTQFMINIYGIHRSEHVWEDPLVFRPERFLNSNNEIINADKIIPFGLGRRSCLGEPVAHVSLFIFFVTLFRKFSFGISPAHPRPSLKNIHGLSRCPIPYFVQMSHRSP